MNMKPRVLALLFLLTLAGLSLVHAVSFPEWQYARFSQAELLDPAVSGEAANPAGDGLSNWLKYAFDLDPHAACIEGAPAPQMLGGALALNFFRRTDYPYLIYALEASPDLRHWSWRNSYQASAVTSLGAVAQWTVADPYQWPAGVSKFLRLRVESGSPDQLFYYPPEDLTARTVRLPFGLELRWSDRSNAEIGYRVERQRLTDGVWDLFAITGQDTISYFDYTVQSGVAYAYRVRAMFPDGVFSAWTESGSVTPGGGGPGGPGGGGPPDPDPDTDGDSIKDSLDAYPHDKRRSRDLPTLTYAEIDLSTPIIGAKDVSMLALDDQNQVAFSYPEPVSGSTPPSLKVVVWKDGAQVGNTYTYPTAQGSDWTIEPQFLNASGAIAGSGANGHRRVFVASAGGTPAFSHGYDSTFLSYEYEPFRVSLSGFNNAGVIWGGQIQDEYYGSHTLDFIGGTKFPYLLDPAHPPDPNRGDAGYQSGPKFTPLFVNATGQAVGQTWSPTAGLSYARKTGGGIEGLTARKLFTIGDDGTIFGVAAGTPPDPGQPSDSLTPKFWKVSDGTPTDVSTLLPAEFRKQISFNENTTAQMNSAGDLLFTTPTLEGPEDAPAWNAKPILWTRQTSTANPNGTLAIVTNPGQSLNKDRFMVAIKDVYPPGADGKPDTTQPSHKAAELLALVIFKTSPDTETGPDKAHKRNLPHLAAYDAYYGKEWGKCVSKVWNTSHKLDLIDYLEGADKPSIRTLFEQSLKWKIDGVEQTSHDADYGSESAEDKHHHLFVEVLSKSGGITVDRLIITVVPRSTKTKWDAWYVAEKADLAWLAALPPMFSSIETTVGTDGYLPRPDRNFNPYLYGVPHSVNTFYHPGASYEMRGLPTGNKNGHQVCYNPSGILLDSGVKAGSADKVMPWAPPIQWDTDGHKNADVKPFVWAAQLDGNPAEGGGTPEYIDLSAPLLYEGGCIKQYLEVRPPVPNTKPRLTPGATP